MMTSQTDDAINQILDALKKDVRLGLHSSQSGSVYTKMRELIKKTNEENKVLNEQKLAHIITGCLVYMMATDENNAYTGFKEFKEIEIPELLTLDAFEAEGKRALDDNKFDPNILKRLNKKNDHYFPHLSRYADALCAIAKKGYNDIQRPIKDADLSKVYQAEYRAQIRKRGLYIGLMVLGAIVFTPFSLIITIRAYLKMIKNESIQKIVLSDEEFNAIKSKRKNYQQLLKDLDEDERALESKRQLASKEYDKMTDPKPKKSIISKKDKKEIYLDKFTRQRLNFFNNDTPVEKLAFGFTQINSNDIIESKVRSRELVEKLIQKHTPRKG